jgi:hypothetical protein
MWSAVATVVLASGTDRQSVLQSSFVQTSEIGGFEEQTNPKTAGRHAAAQADGRSFRLPEGYCLFLALALLFELIALKFVCCTEQHCLCRRYADLSSVHKHFV